MAARSERKRARREPTPRGAAAAGRVVVASSPRHGRGVFAAREFRKGARIGRFEGTPTRRDGPHVLWVEEDEGTWSGRRGTNELRFVNHDARPNAEFQGWDLVALRRIRAGEEITVDYGEGAPRPTRRSTPRQPTTAGGAAGSTPRRRRRS